MAKTFFANGVVVPPPWFNGSHNIYFDGLDEDWHYPPLTNDQIKISGEGGFDKTFVTLYGLPQTIESNKTFSGNVNFTGTVSAIGVNDTWDAKPTDGGTFLNANPDSLVTNKIVLDYGRVIDGGSID